MNLFPKKRILAERLCLAGLLVGVIAAPTTGFAWGPKIIEMPSREAAQTSGTFTIVGAVQRPGSYRLEEKTTRLDQLIERAGGLQQLAGVKVRVLLGGKSGLVLLYPEQRDFELKTGDVVIFERQAVSSARVVNFSDMPAGSASSAGNPLQVIRPVAHEQPVTRGHVVLLGLQSDPVVMPLWTSGLTTDLLLTTYLEQPAQVAEQTRIINGRPGGKSGQELTDGMVLSVPTRLVSAKSLPPLPPVITAALEVPAGEQRPGQASSEKNGQQENSPFVPRSLDFLRDDRLAGGSELLPVPATSSALPRNAEPEIPVAPQSGTDRPTHAESPAAEESQSLLIPSTLPGELPDSTRESDSRIQRNTQTLAGELVPTTEMERRLPADFTSPGSRLTLRPSTGEASTDSAAEEQLAGDQQSAELLSEAKLSDVWLEEFVEKAGGQHSLETRLAQTQEVQHLASADEVVPPPRDRPAVEKVPLAGLISGFLVLAGVLIVISTAVRRKLLTMFSQNLPAPSLWHPDAATAHSTVSPPQREPIMRQNQRKVSLPVSLPDSEPDTVESPAALHLAKPETAPEVAEETYSKAASVVEENITIPPAAPEQQVATFTQSTAVESVQLAPQNLTPSKQGETISLQTETESPASEQIPEEIAQIPEMEAVPHASESERVLLAWLNWPIQEEAVEFPREMRFFGKPQQHYEFRIDARHALRKPHILQTAAPQSELIGAGIARTAEQRTAQAESTAAPEQRQEMVEAPSNQLASESTQRPWQTNPEAGLFASAYARAQAEQKKPDGSCDYA